jgi:hypothetical protein
MTDFSPLHGSGWIRNQLDVSRTTLWRLRRTDPDFPKPIIVRDTPKWSERDIAEYVKVLRARQASDAA